MKVAVSTWRVCRSLRRETGKYPVVPPAEYERMCAGASVVWSSCQVGNPEQAMIHLCAVGRGTGQVCFIDLFYGI